MLGQLMGAAAGVARVLLDREAAIVGHRSVPVVPIRRSGPTIDFVEVRCAGCGCIVDAGIRVSVCGDPNCCCRELRTRGPDPTAEATSDSES